MREFLCRKLGEARSNAIYPQVQTRLEALRSSAETTTPMQEKILKKLLLPRVALYQILLEQEDLRAHALDIMEDYMMFSAGLPLRKKYEMMDSLPCAYGLFRAGFTRVVKSLDLWDADIDKSQKDSFSVTMHRCFWHDTFSQYGCPEICQFACMCDDITYNNLTRIDYSRTETLGTGGSCCDFKFTKKHPNKEQKTP